MWVEPAGGAFAAQAVLSGTMDLVLAGSAEVSQFRGAEMIAEHWDISREAMEEFAYTSHQRAIAAIDEGCFERETVPFGDLRHDEGRAGTRAGSGWPGSSR